jgi:hypothetical protein
VSGFFDAEGSVPKNSLNVEFTNGDESELDLLASYLDEWGFLYTRSAGHNRKMGRPLYTLRLVSFELKGNSLSPEEKHLQKQAEQQRFFDTYRPAVTRKYGPYLRRWGHEDKGAADIALQCKEKLVVVTGAEPLEQNLDELIDELASRNHVVQVETSGAFDFKGINRPDILVCSPKPNMKYRIAPTVYESATIFKLVNGPKGSGFDWNKELAAKLKSDGKHVFVMPYGGPPSKAAIAAAKTIADAEGYELSPRLHYELGLR